MWKVDAGRSIGLMGPMSPMSRLFIPVLERPLAGGDRLGGVVVAFQQREREDAVAATDQAAVLFPAARAVVALAALLARPVVSRRPAFDLVRRRGDPALRGPGELADLEHFAGVAQDVREHRAIGEPP